MGDTQKFHSVADLARRFRRSERSIRDWIAHGCPVPGGRIALPGVKAGKRILVSSDDLELFELRLGRAFRQRPTLDLD